MSGLSYRHLKALPEDLHKSTYQIRQGQIQLNAISQHPTFQRHRFQQLLHRPGRPRSCQNPSSPLSSTITKMIKPSMGESSAKESSAAANRIKMIGLLN